MTARREQVLQHNRILEGIWDIEINLLVKNDYLSLLSVRGHQKRRGDVRNVRGLIDAWSVDPTPKSTCMVLCRTILDQDFNASLALLVQLCGASTFLGFHKYYSRYPPPAYCEVIKSKSK